MKFLRYLILYSRKTFKQIVSVSWAILTNKITFSPKFLIQFEENFASFCGKKYALSFCNGTSAIEAAVFVLGLKKGDEVIVPSCTFHASIDPICNAGATPIFADVSLESFTLCPDDVRKKITAKTKAIMIVHLFGIPANMKEFTKISQEYKIDLIEDTSHAHGAMAAGKLCGTYARIGAFSLQGAKAIAAGEGGIAVTDRREDYIRMSLWGHFSRHAAEFQEIGCQEFAHTGFGTKRRMAPLSSLLAQADLDEIHHLNEILNQATDELNIWLQQIPEIILPKLRPGDRRGGFFCGYAFAVKSSKAQAKDVIEALKQIGLKAENYPFARHHQLAIYHDLERRQALAHGWPGPPPQALQFPTLKNTESLEKNMVLIPRRCLVTLSKGQARKIAACLKKIV